MGVFEHFPYTNFHDLNLDWILKIIKELDSEVNTFIEQNVLSYADPIDWNITTQYAKNTVVVDPVTGTAYMSIATVPEGILLTNTSYWQPIFNYQQTVATMKEQIAAVDFGDGNATQDIPIYTLFWYKNVLYRALRAIDAGSTVIVGTNAEHVTVEEAITAIKSAGDITRTGANIVDTATGDYTETGTDKTENFTNKTQNITGDEEVDVDGTLFINTTNPVKYSKPVDNTLFFKSVPMTDTNGNQYDVLVKNDVTDTINGGIYKSATANGYDNTGATDISATLYSETSNIGFPAGTYKVSTSGTVSANIAFVGGSVLSIDSGVTVTITGSITAGRYQIFSGDGSVQYSGTGYPEWFGAVTNNSTIDNSIALNTAYTSCNGLSLDYGTYYVKSTVYFNASGKHVIGKGRGRAFDATANQTLISSSDSITILQIGDATNSTYDQYFSHFGVWQSSTLSTSYYGIYIVNTAFCTLDNILSRGANAFHAEGNTHLTFNECHAFPRGTAPVNGFYFDNTKSNPTTTSTGNVSTYITNCTVEGNSTYTTYGLQWNNGCSDLFIDGFETSYCSIGINILGDSTTGTLHDIIINRSIIDTYTAGGITVRDASNAGITISNCYCAGTEQGIRLYDVNGMINCTGNQIYKGSYDSTCMIAQNCSGLISKNNCFRGAPYNLQGTTRNCAFEDVIQLIGSYSGNLNFAADIRNCTFKPYIKTDSGTFTNFLYATTADYCDIDVTGMAASVVTNAILSVAGTTYNAIGTAGTNTISGVYG